jgi:hypothetical protein
MKAALFALHYIHSTYNYGISFTPKNMALMHSYIHYPPLTDIKAYTDATPPTPLTTPTFSTYSNACWGSQIGNAVAVGTLLMLFKFQSMNGVIFFCNGGQLDGLESARNVLLSALVRQRFVPQAPLPKRSSITEISVEASLIQDFLFLMLPHQWSSTMTMTPVSNGLTI